MVEILFWGYVAVLVGALLFVLWAAWTACRIADEQQDRQARHSELMRSLSEEGD
jgi:sensor domain CHASE-containing protein